MYFEIAIRASRGARRAQEDTAVSWPLADGPDAPYIGASMPAAMSGRIAAVLCDGMGGHIGGAVASQTACEAFLPHLLATAKPVRDRLIAALEHANATISERVAETPSLSGMGCTLVAAEADANGLAWVSVGDSLLFLWRQGAIVQLNADHSLAPEIDKLAESGKISWAAAQADPRRHYLRSALTGDEIEMIDLSDQTAPLLAGDVVMLASDGIHTLESSVIADVISDCAHVSAATIAERLISTINAIERAHQDNTTIAAIRVLASVPIQTGRTHV